MPGMFPEIGVSGGSGGGGFAPQLAQLTADTALTAATNVTVLTFNAGATGKFAVDATLTHAMGSGETSIEVFLTVNGVIVAAAQFNGFGTVFTAGAILPPVTLSWKGSVTSGQAIALVARCTGGAGTAKAATTNSGNNTATTLSSVQTQ